MKYKKLIIGIAAVLGIIYLLSLAKKAKCNCADKTKPCDCEDEATEVGGNATQTRTSQFAGVLNMPKPGSPGTRISIAIPNAKNSRVVMYGCKDGTSSLDKNVCANHGGLEWINEHAV